MENSQIEEPDYLDGRYVYEPDFEDSQVGTGPGTDFATSESVDGAEPVDAADPPSVAA